MSTQIPNTGMDQVKLIFCFYNSIVYGSHHSGDKYVKGDITVKQNLVFPSDKNPFGVDLQDLQSKALSKTKDQTISVPYEINSVSSVDQMTVKKVLLEPKCKWNSYLINTFLACLAIFHLIQSKKHSE